MSQFDYTLFKPTHQIYFYVILKNAHINTNYYVIQALNYSNKYRIYINPRMCFHWKGSPCNFMHFFFILYLGINYSQLHDEMITNDLHSQAAYTIFVLNSMSEAKCLYILYIYLCNSFCQPMLEIQCDSLRIYSRIYICLLCILCYFCRKLWALRRVLDNNHFLLIWQVANYNFVKYYVDWNFLKILFPVYHLSSKASINENRFYRDITFYVVLSQRKYHIIWFYNSRLLWRFIKI